MRLNGCDSAVLMALFWLSLSLPRPFTEKLAHVKQSRKITVTKRAMHAQLRTFVSVRCCIHLHH